MHRRLVLHAGGERVAIAAEAVREVVPLAALTRVPHGPPALLGLAGLRGAAVPVLSLTALMQRPVEPVDRLVVLDRADPVALAVAGVPRLEEAADGALLDPDPLIARTLAAGPGRAAQRRTVIAARAPEPMRDGIGLLAFLVAGQRFALPLDEVEALIAVPPEILPLPGGGAAALGSTMHRAAVLPLLSLAGLLGLPAGPATARARVVIVRSGRARIGLAVEAVEAVLRVSETAIDPVPAVLTRGAGEARIRAILRGEDGRLVSLLATDRLVDEALTARLAAEIDTDAVAAATAEMAEQVLVFHLGAEAFGLPVAAVREVVAMPDRLTRLPHAPDFVEGLMTLRGEAVPVIDQRRRFGVAGRAPAGRRVIVAAFGPLRAGFAVDGVSEMLRLRAAALRPAPEMGEGARLFDRVADGGGMVLVIDPEQLLGRTEREMVAAMADRS